MTRAPQSARGFALVAAVAFIVYAVSQYDITCISNLHGDTSRLAECRK